MKRHKRPDGRTIIAWYGRNPVYASPALLAWRARLAELRARIEALPDGDRERAEILSEYYRVMGER